MGLLSMVTYYRFFHPAGPIRGPCATGARKSVDFKNDLSNPAFEAGEEQDPNKTAPDFVIEFTEEAAAANQSTSTRNDSSGVTPPKRPTHGMLKHSRSFKKACPQRRADLPLPPSPVLPRGGSSSLGSKVKHIAAYNIGPGTCQL